MEKKIFNYENIKHNNWVTIYKFNDLQYGKCKIIFSKNIIISKFENFPLYGKFKQTIKKKYKKVIEEYDNHPIYGKCKLIFYKNKFFNGIF